MKIDWNRIIIFVGILSIGYIINGNNNVSSGDWISNTIQANGFDLFILILGFVLIFYFRASLKLHKNEEEKFDFRETDSDENCLKCRCCNPKSLTDCKFFHIKIDEHHICDLLEPQIEEEILKEQNKAINK